MKKFHRFLEKTGLYNDCSGKLPKGLTPYIFYRLTEIYNALETKQTEYFIEKEINDILTGFGIKTFPSGIGWRV